MVSNLTDEEFNDIVKNAVREEFPPEQSNSSDKPTVDLPSQNESVKTLNAHFEMTKQMYINVLSPQLSQNEELKRTQKQELMNKIFKILKVQFIFTYSLISAAILAIIFSYYLHMSDNTITLLISLFKFYVTAIIGELIAILFFIVKNVFDKSIVDLISNFDKKDKNRDDSEI